MNDYTDPTPIASSEDFKRALIKVRDDGGIGATQLAMLRAHCRAPGHTITATQLAQNTGLADYSTANLHYGKLAHVLADALGYRSTHRVDGTTRWWFTLAVGRDGSDGTETGHFEWVMRDELVSALEEMRWA